MRRARYWWLLSVAVTAAGLLCEGANAEAATGQDAAEVVGGSSPPNSGDATEGGGDGAGSEPEDSSEIASTLTVMQKLKDFPMLGKEAAGLLQMAEEGLGLNLSKLELGKIVPMLSDLQKTTHEHYLITKAAGKPSMPSSLLKRFVGRKSQSRVIKTMKKFAPNTDDGELIQQLNVVTQLIHELHDHPENAMPDILKRVASAVGFNLEADDMEHIQTHMKWAQDLVTKFFPHLPDIFGGSGSDEL